MLVYGDHGEIAGPRERLEAIQLKLEQVAEMPPGIERHAKLVGMLIDAGQLLQGVADAGAPTCELDEFVYRLAGAVVRSWDSRFQDAGSTPATPKIDLPERVELRLPEGFAFYAVYPEAYIQAARRLRLSGEPRVIGIRSIGTTLGAVVAAALEAPVPATVRPFGDPFARQVELPDDVLEARAHYVIVDEGPGLSGSSFGAVADWLESRGVPPERIAFLPSHAGDPGPQSSELHRERWNRAQRVSAEFDSSFLTDMFGPLEDFSTGSPGERRKFFGVKDGTRVLLKFAGLGAIGERKLEMARALHAAGFTPEPLGLVHGFLVERLCEDAEPLGQDDKPVEEIGRYIGARARLFPAHANSGASIDELLTMCRRNISLALGQEAAGSVDRFDGTTSSARLVRLRTDNKLDRHEWLRLADGRLLKADALDHHQAHDLIGCQDVSWDVAGGIVEFALDADQARLLIDVAEDASGRAVDVELLALCRIAYPAFRLGQAVMSSGGTPGAAQRYLSDLQLLLESSSGATRQESSVGGRAERTASGTNPCPFG